MPGKCQTENPELKNSVEYMNGRSDKCEERVSQLDGRKKTQDDILRNTLKTAKKMLYQLLANSKKTNIKLIGDRYYNTKHIE